MSRVMISYSHDDREFVSHLDATLSEQGIDAWIDVRGIRPGYPWRQEIFRAIIDCEHLIACLSHSYLASNMCRTEMYLARCYRKTILPIMIGNSTCWDQMGHYKEMAGVEDIHTLDFVNGRTFGLPKSREEMFGELVEVIRGTAPSENLPDAYVSYRTKDAVYATQVADGLRRLGVGTWIATRSYRPGDHGLQKQWEALMQAKALLVILSEDVAQSEQMRNEILLANTRGIPIFPVLLHQDDLRTHTRAIHQNLTNSKSFEMRLLEEIHWFYPNRPSFPGMLEQLAANILPSG